MDKKNKKNSFDNRYPGEEYHAVFFNNRPAYIVSEPNETFIEDLKNRRMKSKHDAEKAY